MLPSEHADTYFGLLRDLQKVLQKPVALIEPGRIRNPYFKQSIREAQVLLYEAA
jgi:predicted nucleotidyltransferase